MINPWGKFSGYPYINQQIVEWPVQTYECGTIDSVMGVRSDPAFVNVDAATTPVPSSVNPTYVLGANTTPTTTTTTQETSESHWVLLGIGLLILVLVVMDEGE